MNAKKMMSSILLAVAFLVFFAVNNPASASLSRMPTTPPPIDPKPGKLILSPVSGSPGMTITATQVEGSRLGIAWTVLFEYDAGGEKWDLSPTWASSTQLKFLVPPDAACGSYHISLLLHVPNQEQIKLYQPVPFQVVAPCAAVPQIFLTSLAGSPAAPGAEVTVYGSNFQPGAVVWLAGLSANTRIPAIRVQSGQLQSTLPSNEFADPYCGNPRIAVKNPALRQVSNRVTINIACPSNPFRAFFTFNSVHPDDREMSGEGANSEEAQGIAFTGQHWYFSSKEAIYSLTKGFYASDNMVQVAGQKLFGSTNCDHVGGLDFYENELYAAIDHCSDGKVRVAVFSPDLKLMRSAVIDGMSSLGWVAVNPLDDDYFYIEGLRAYPRNFQDGYTLIPHHTLYFDGYPTDVGVDLWNQGGAFSKSGLFFLTVDDPSDEFSFYTGIWIYKIDYPIRNLGVARHVGSISNAYDPDSLFWRKDELEDLDASMVDEGPTQGDVHLLLVTNELGEDDIKVFHYTSSDFDHDGIKDTLDNCLMTANPNQSDQNGNGLGDACDAVSNNTMPYRVWLPHLRQPAR